MEEQRLISIQQQFRAALNDLFNAADSTLKPGDLFVIGCSTSEVGGKLIGTGSSTEIAKALMDVLLPELQKRQLFLAVQCCEHLNRSLVVEDQAMQQHDLTEVWVTPWLHAGGAMAMEALARFEKPVLVEDLKARASAGIDIGGTFIGMHLHPVVVPIHSQNRRIGEASITMARTRPKFVGGPRAHYDMVQNAH